MPKLKAALIGFGLGIALVFGSAAAVLAADKGGPKHQDIVAPASWTGLWAGIALGYGVEVGKEESDGTYPSATAFTGGVSAGFDTQLGKQIVLGVFGDYDHLFNVKPNADNAADGGWTIGGRGGVLLTPSILAYGLIGHTTAVGKADVSGMVFGGGLEARLGDGWSTKLEYRNLDVNADDGDSNLHQVRVGLSYKFAWPQ